MPNCLYSLCEQQVLHNHFSAICLRRVSPRPPETKRHTGSEFIMQPP